MKQRIIDHIKMYQEMKQELEKEDGLNMDDGEFFYIQGKIQTLRNVIKDLENIVNS